MSTVSLMAHVNGVIYLKNGDSLAREFVETFELLDLHQDLINKMLDESDTEEVVRIYSYWVANLTPATSIRLTTTDHYLGDPESPINPDTFFVTTLEAMHLQNLDSWMESHNGWFISVQVDDF